MITADVRLRWNGDAVRQALAERLRRAALSLAGEAAEEIKAALPELARGDVLVEETPGSADVLLVRAARRAAMSPRVLGVLRRVRDGLARR